MNKIHSQCQSTTVFSSYTSLFLVICVVCWYSIWICWRTAAGWERPLYWHSFRTYVRTHILHYMFFINTYKFQSSPGEQIKTVQPRTSNFVSEIYLWEESLRVMCWELDGVTWFIMAGLQNTWQDIDVLLNTAYSTYSEKTWTYNKCLVLFTSINI